MFITGSCYFSFETSMAEEQESLWLPHVVTNEPKFLSFCCCLEATPSFSLSRLAGTLSYKSKTSLYLCHCICQTKSPFKFQALVIELPSGPSCYQWPFRRRLSCAVMDNLGSTRLEHKPSPGSGNSRYVSPNRPQAAVITAHFHDVQSQTN